MRTVYVDTSAFLALLWTRDRDHQPMRERYRRLRDERARLVTADPVISETATRLRYDAGLPAAQTFATVIREAADAGTLLVRESDADLRTKAFALMARYESLQLSYADCVGAAVATEFRVDAVLGLDNDFRVIGFVLEP